MFIEGHGRLRAELVRRVLARWPSARVLEAEDGESGLEVCERRRPDVVVTDVVLTTMGGFDLIAAMRRLQADVKVIIFSLYDNSQFREMARQSGALAYIGKEQPLEDILGAIEAALASGAHSGAHS